MFLRVHTPSLVANLWRRLRDRHSLGFLHAEGNVLPKAPSQSDLPKSVFMDFDSEKLSELIIGGLMTAQNKRGFEAG